MNPTKFTCPSCGKEMELAFCAKASGLSYTKPSSFTRTAFLDKDLSEAGLRKLIPWKGEWHKASICEGCSIYTIEYAEAFDRAEVEKIIAEQGVDPNA
jgi:hypothetical protein